MDKWTKTKAS